MSAPALTEPASEVVARFTAAWADHDLPAALALVSDDCVFETTTPPDGTPVVGRSDIAQAWRPMFEDAGSRFTVEETFAAGSRVVQRWRYDFPGGHVRGVDLFTVEDGRVTAKLAYVKG